LFTAAMWFQPNDGATIGLGSTTFTDLTEQLWVNRW
jgi:hypothetical protein